MSASKDTIVERVLEAGIVGAGGGGFPSHVKIKGAADTVIANGAECEPLLSTDLYIMENFAAEIVEGLRLVMLTTGASKGYIALKKKYTTAVENINLEIGKTSDISLSLMENYYPAGDELEIVADTLGRIIPEGGIPLDVGVVVINVNTLLNIARAVKSSQAVTKRWVTVLGEVEEPYIAEVPLGISAGELIDAAKPRISSYAILAGGPMMGSIVGKDYRISKLCGGIIVLPEDHAVIIKHGSSRASKKRRAKSTCDQCFDCTIVCPRFLLGHDLEPHRVMRSLFVAPEHPKEHLTNSFLCSECGLCNMFACPLDLSPRDMFREIKEAFFREGIKNPHTNTNLEMHPERDFRRVNADRLVLRLDLKKYDIRPEVKTLSGPQEVSIPLCQHIGAPAVPLVKKGDKVKEGTLIADIPADSLGARVHASISGIVSDIDANGGEIKIKA